MDCFNSFSHIGCHFAADSLDQFGPVGVNINLQSAPNDFSQLSSNVVFLSSILSITESSFLSPVDLLFCFEDASPEPESSSSSSSVDSAGVKVNVYSLDVYALLEPDFATTTRKVKSPSSHRSSSSVASILNETFPDLDFALAASSHSSSSLSCSKTALLLGEADEIVATILQLSSDSPSIISSSPLQSPVTLNLTVCFFGAALATCVVASRPSTATAEITSVFIVLIVFSP